MFVYGVCAGPSEKFERIAQPGLFRSAKDPVIIVKRGQHSIHEAYNAILDETAHLDGVEGVVLLHDDTEITDRAIESKLRTAFNDPSVGLVGVIGGRGHSTMAWWESPEKRGRVRDDQQGLIDYGAGTYPVDTVDGLLLAFPARTCDLIRFDTSTYPRSFHAYDADICAQVRRAGLQVLVVDVHVHHRNNPNAWLGDELTFSISDLSFQLKWRSQPATRRLRLVLRRRVLVVRRQLRDFRRGLAARLSAVINRGSGAKAPRGE